MNPEFIQNLRYKLQRRVRRVHSTRAGLFHYAILHFWRFLSGNPIFSSIIEELRARIPDAKESANKIGQRLRLFGDNEFEQAAIASWVLEACSKDSDAGIEQNIGFVLHASEADECVEVFFEQIVEPLYDYLDEQIDDKVAIPALIIRYQHRTEWFRKDVLYRAWADETTRGEKALALNLYEYLYEQGIEFYIESFSISGEVDLIGAQTGPEPLLADVKIFCPEKSKGESYLKTGFHQVYTYCRDHNQSCGYLVIFNLSPDDLRILTKNHAQSVSYVTYNNKTIFFIVINLYPHTVPASKRGIMKCHELKEDDLFRALPTGEEGSNQRDPRSRPSSLRSSGYASRPSRPRSKLPPPRHGLPSAGLFWCWTMFGETTRKRSRPARRSRCFARRAGVRCRSLPGTGVPVEPQHPRGPLPSNHGS